MINDEEKRFVRYWHQNRLREKKLWRQLAVGLPIGLLFGILIFANFATGWYKRANMWAMGHSGNGGSLIVAIAFLLIASFTAVFYKQHRWEQLEQQYLEIKAKMTDEEWRLLNTKSDE
jgi:hypothetical protein